MEQENWIYDKSVCMPDVRCDSYPIYKLGDDISLNVILSCNNEYYIEIGISNNGIYRDWFEISLERPFFIQEPVRNLSRDEKIKLTNTISDRWEDIINTMKDMCFKYCAYDNGGCDKYNSNIILSTPPDYTKLPDLK